MSTGERRTVAYVLPVHDEAENLAPFHAALIASTEKRPDLDFEFVYAAAGTGAAPPGRLLNPRPADAGVPVMGLPRTSGPQTAVPAGLDAVPAADAVVVMDTDLQD